LGVSRLIVVMGVSSCGKTTVGKALARHLGWPFIEGDAHHPPANIAKMSSGTPLDDADRAAWLDAILGDISGQTGAGVVLACSALTPYVQGRLAGADAGQLIWALLELDRATAIDRMTHRDHFMPPALIDSQLAALDIPRGALRFDATRPLTVLVEEIACCVCKRA